MDEDELECLEAIFDDEGQADRVFQRIDDDVYIFTVKFEKFDFESSSLQYLRAVGWIKHVKINVLKN